MDGDGYHQTEKAAAVRPYVQNVGRPTAEVIGVLGWWKVKVDQDDLYRDGSTKF